MNKTQSIHFKEIARYSLKECLYYMAPAQGTILCEIRISELKLPKKRSINISAETYTRERRTSPREVLTGSLMDFPEAWHECKLVWTRILLWSHIRAWSLEMNKETKTGSGWNHNDCLIHFALAYNARYIHTVWYKMDVNGTVRILKVVARIWTRDKDETSILHIKSWCGALRQTIKDATWCILDPSQ